MKIFILIAFSVLCGNCIGQAYNSNQNNPSISSLSWLEGNWIRSNNKPGRTTYEHWLKESERSMVGQGITLVGNDTSFVENLKVIEKDNRLFYVAEVSHNAAPVNFEIEITGKNSFISRNPQHDFPKNIAYKLDGDILTATISGNGKSIDFIFKRLE